MFLYLEMNKEASIEHPSSIRFSNYFKKYLCSYLLYKKEDGVLELFHSIL